MEGHATCVERCSQQLCKVSTPCIDDHHVVCSPFVNTKQYCHVENTAKQCRLGLFQDSDFAGDLEGSKSTSGGTLCVFGSHTFVPISGKTTEWFTCKGGAAHCSMSDVFWCGAVGIVVLVRPGAETRCALPFKCCAGVDIAQWLAPLCLLS